MLIDVIDKTRIERICRHEVGHWVIARKMGFSTHEIRVVIHPSKGHLASSTLEPWMPQINDIPSTIEYIRKRLVVLYAGAIAESLDQYGKYDGALAIYEWENGGARDDFAKIRELLHVLRNLEYPNTTIEEEASNQLSQLANESCQRAGESVTHENELITKLSNLLIERIREYNHEYEISSKELGESYEKY